ncbi:MAG: carboxy-S-adenosyl-L-methionine synthase CmoA [Woeseiaceae bacterium]
MPKDKIFAGKDASPGSFEFNDAVADVFPDMLRRSIPGYDATIDAIGALASRYIQPGTKCYDLGCSLGAATLAIQRNICVPDCEILAVDNAPAMIERCQKILSQASAKVTTQVVEADVRQVAIENASMVVMNYTLQFVPPGDRLAMIKRIYAGMTPGGVFVLSEKVADDDADVEGLLVDLHHDFKRRNAYSDLEISRKRTAIENVLIPETTCKHLRRLKEAGFEHMSVWLKHFNFISIIAIK